jgi:BASS family bile acid:Na+ symporter
VLFTVVGLTVGHLLGGPDPHDRCPRAGHGDPASGVAMAIAAFNFPISEPLRSSSCITRFWARLSFPYVKWHARVNKAARGNATA